MQIVLFSQTLIISTSVCNFQAGKEPTYTSTQTKGASLGVGRSGRGFTIRGKEHFEESKKVMYSLHFYNLYPSSCCPRAFKRGTKGTFDTLQQVIAAGWSPTLDPAKFPSMHQGGCFVWPRRTGTFLAGAGRWLLLLLLWQCQDTVLDTAGTAPYTACYTVRYIARYTACYTACYTGRYTARRSMLKKEIVHRALAINRGVSCWYVWRWIAWRNKMY